jgi:hypothetical protein
MSRIDKELTEKVFSRSRATEPGAEGARHYLEGI